MANKKKHTKIIGYTTGVYDLFHIGHVNLLRNARSLCDHLIVGVTTDDLTAYKYKKAVIPFKERVEIVGALQYVDTVVHQYDMDKMSAWKKLKFDVMFVGDDWHSTPKWEQLEEDFKKVGVKIVYIPYTRGTSSTLINQILLEKRGSANKKRSVKKKSGTKKKR
jgi:glycerol-3-phosphate cytidylyltransferase